MPAAAVSRNGSSSLAIRATRRSIPSTGSNASPSPRSPPRAIRGEDHGDASALSLSEVSWQGRNRPCSSFKDRTIAAVTILTPTRPRSRPSWAFRQNPSEAETGICCPLVRLAPSASCWKTDGQAQGERALRFRPAPNVDSARCPSPMASCGETSTMRRSTTFGCMSAITRHPTRSFEASSACPD